MGVIGQQHTRNRNWMKFSSKTVQVPSKENNSFGPTELDELHCILYFVGLLIQIGHINLFTVVSKKILHTFQNSSKQEVLRSFYQYGNGRLCLRLQILCISVWLKSLLMYYS